MCLLQISSHGKRDTYITWYGDELLWKYGFIPLGFSLEGSVSHRLGQSLGLKASRLQVTIKRKSRPSVSLNSAL